MYGRDDNSKVIMASVAFAAVLVLLLGIYLIFFYSSKCESQECFIKNLGKCSRSSFVNEQNSTTWQYAIQGSKNGLCVVDVTAKLIDTDDEETKTLEGKSMICSIPLEISGTFFPESRLEYCHGLFKEGLQEILLKRINQYVLQNIGEINQSVSGDSSNLA